MHDCLLPFLFFFSSGGHFVQPNGTILTILVKGRKRDISVTILKFDHRPERRCRLKVFLFLALTAILFQSGTSLAILVKGHQRNISVKLN